VNARDDSARFVIFLFFVERGGISVDNVDLWLYLFFLHQWLFAHCFAHGVADGFIQIARQFFLAAFLNDFSISPESSIGFSITVFTCRYGPYLQFFQKCKSLFGI